MSLNLPECYLADLPPGASLNAELIREACRALRRNREAYLAQQSTHQIVRNLEAAAALWTQPRSEFMELVRQCKPEETGFSWPTLTHGLQSLFSSITAENLEAWIEQDLGHPGRLDRFCANASERESRRSSMASGPELLVHITAGNIPVAAIMNMLLGLMVRSCQFVKCATGSSRIPRLFAHSVRYVDPHLGACLELAEWPRKRSDLDEAIFGEADCVTATGSDEAVQAIRNSLPACLPLVGHGHKVSFIYLCLETASGSQLEQIVEQAAEDVAAWNQLGCLSPHVIYVEKGGTATAETFAQRLAAQLDALESRRPRGPVSTEESAAIRARRSFYEVRASHLPDTMIWKSEGSTAWTVVLEDGPQFQLSCLNRFVYVKPVESLEEALHGADAVRRHVSTVALAAASPRAEELARDLARWGVTRICPVGTMQQPPVGWRHDGRPALGEVVRWTDWEQPGF